MFPMESIEEPRTAPIRLPSVEIEIADVPRDERARSRYQAVVSLISHFLAFLFRPFTRR